MCLGPQTCFLFPALYIAISASCHKSSSCLLFFFLNLGDKNEVSFHCFLLFWGHFIGRKMIQFLWLLHRLILQSICVCVSLSLPLKTAAEMKVVKRWRRNIHLALSPTIPVCFRPIASSPSLYLSPSAPLSLCLQGKSCSLSNYLCDSLLACVCVCVVRATERRRIVPACKSISLTS